MAARLRRPVLPEEVPQWTALIEDTTAFITAYCTGSWDRTAPPAVFKAVTCSEVIRNLSAAPGVIMERTGELEVQYQAAASVLGLSEAARTVLRPYRRTVGSIRVTVQ
ncbi:hypothetical protein ACIRBX_11940 [Kitasatospora sp. NPDC096147]|uniref:hypothetical protein n=1 Tax=Kitasatospora sp. NPDC096147 TaxID=3364093 RepID=UPI0037FFE0CB